MTTLMAQSTRMQTEISKSQFKAHALEIFRRVEATGEPVVVTDHGTPKLIVRKYTGSAIPVRERLKGSVLRYESPLEPVSADEWEAII